ncbi:MAG: trypsin-like peptidase domain-containing protein [Pseudomonadota bacterium]
MHTIQITIDSGSPRTALIGASTFAIRPAIDLGTQVVMLVWAILLVLLPLDASAGQFQNLFDRVHPSVVTLHTVGRLSTPRGLTSAEGIGSGVIIDEHGHVMTAAHVVQSADLVQVEFVDGFETTAAIIYSDPARDVSLLKLDELPDGMTWSAVGNSDSVRTGDEVFVIGAPLGLSHTLTTGVISSRRPAAPDESSGLLAEVLQTDASINQGNSGGPLYNTKGEIIGIVSHIRSSSGGSQGLGFAVAINDASKTLLTDNRPWTGMTGVMISGRIARALNVPQPHSILVQRTARNSPSSRFGLRSSDVPVMIGGRELLVGGDIILAVNDIDVSPNFDDDLLKNRDQLDNSLTRLTVLRDGKRIVLTGPPP